MSDDFYGDWEDAKEWVRAHGEKIAVARARYRVQEDFNRELVNEIANKTGHENLAAACFVDVDLDSHEGLDVCVYHNWHVIDGLYSSKSSYHQDGDKWKTVTKHHGMSREEFWNDLNNLKDELGDEWKNVRESHGIVDTEWIMDNFWDGVYYATNGWPLGNVEFLSVYRYNDVSAISVIEAYHNRYANSGKFAKYIQEEINKMK